MHDSLVHGSRSPRRDTFDISHAGLWVALVFGVVVLAGAPGVIAPDSPLAQTIDDTVSLAAQY